MINKVGLNFKILNINSKSMPVNKTNKAEFSAANFDRNINNSFFNPSYCNISFTSKKELTPLEKSYIGLDEIRISDLFELEEEIDIPYNLMPDGRKKYNAAGLNIAIDDYGFVKKYTISNKKDNIIAIARVNKSAKELPEVIYKQGKYMPEITIKDSSLNGKAIKMLAGSELKSTNFEIKMPGQFEPMPGEGYKNISFTGKATFTTYNMEKNTKNAVESYLNSDYVEDAIDGDYKDEVVKNNPEVICLSPAIANRLKNLTRYSENKLSLKIPTDPSYRLIGSVLNQLVCAGVLNGDETDEVKFISQKHEIPKGKNVFWVPEFSHDGGAVAEGFKRGIINENSDSIIINADVFSNADLSRAYHALKTLPDAAVVIPYYPVGADRAKSFNLISVDEDAKGNFIINHFVEKPRYTIDPPDPNDFSFVNDYDVHMSEYEDAQTALNPHCNDTFLASSGMYFLSKEANKILMAQGIINPDMTDLASEVMPKIIDMINKGLITDKNGKPLKAYTVPLEAKGGRGAYWDDLGTAESFLKLIKQVAAQTQINGIGPENRFYGLSECVMYDFHSNVDLDTGVVYDSYEARSAFDRFKNKYNVENMQGNIYIAGR